MPSAAPSAAPAGSEESSPTYVPTADGIEIVTTATDAPAAVPASDRSSGGMVHMTNFLLASLVAGAGGVMWLFA